LTTHLLLHRFHGLLHWGCLTAGDFAELVNLLSHARELIELCQSFEQFLRCVTSDVAEVFANAESVIACHYLPLSYQVNVT